MATNQIPWDELNPEQADAVRSVDESLLVLAPVGTGKTNVLALRAANAIEKGYAPRSLLCLSFTNKAARVMKTRLEALIGTAAREVTACTFHSLCARILRAEAETIGLDSDFLIYDDEDSRSLFSLLLPRIGLRVPQSARDNFEFTLYNAACLSRLSPWEDTPAKKPQAIYDKLVGLASLKGFDPPRLDFPALLRAYVHELRDNHALDFADLIAGVNRLWDESPEALERWRARFQWVQVDEVQDTNRSEYRPLKLLAEPHRKLSFFGDIDQTIYEWRGSTPHEILGDFRQEFAPVREVHLTLNYRSTRTILAACERVVLNCPGSVTRRIEPVAAEVGDAVILRELPDLATEAEWIAQEIVRLRTQHDLKFSDFAVLTRDNFLSRDLSRHFESLGLPHVKVDEQKFFQRAEIKAALAHLRMIAGRHDSEALTRFLKTPPKGIGEATVEALRGEPRKAGLKIGDLLQLDAHEDGDPFGQLLGAWRENRLVMFDLETTGLDTANDGIVEVAAALCGAGGVTARFHEYIRPEVAVGDSVAIHGHTQEFLDSNGRPANEVLAEFVQFCDGRVLAGHNVIGFDVPMLASGLARAGIEWARPNVFDTLDLARRFLRPQRATLAALCAQLNVATTPTHKAMDDVEATVGLLAALWPQLEGGEAARRSAVAKHGRAFLPVARKLDHWRERANLERPAELLGRVLDESRLAEFYEKETEGPNRIENLKTLLLYFTHQDDSQLDPPAALRHLLATVALEPDAARQALAEDKVPLLTVHQAKGMEFDTVFVAGAAEGQFPNRRSVKEGRLDEEHRLFYVAVSRAKKRLLVSWPAYNKFGSQQQPSRYLTLLSAQQTRRSDIP